MQQNIPHFICSNSKAERIINESDIDDVKYC